MDEIKPVLEVLSATTEPMTANVYEPVKAGVVVVRGQVLSVRYDFLEQTWRPVLPGGEDLRLEGERPSMKPKVIPDVLDEDPRFGSMARLQMLFTEFVFLRAATYIWEGTISSEGTEVVALLLAKTRDQAVAGEETYQRRGLVLYAFDSEKVRGSDSDNQYCMKNHVFVMEIDQITGYCVGTQWAAMYEIMVTKY